MGHGPWGQCSNNRSTLRKPGGLWCGMSSNYSITNVIKYWPGITKCMHALGDLHFNKYEQLRVLIIAMEITKYMHALGDRHFNKYERLKSIVAAHATPPPVWLTHNPNSQTASQRRRRLSQRCQSCPPATRKPTVTATTGCSSCPPAAETRLPQSEKPRLPQSEKPEHDLPR
jgi:hypothetical protein